MFSPTRISLAGEWDFRFDDEATWRRVAVPGCWEMLDVPKDRAGPAWYRTRFVVPPEAAGRRLWLRFGGVSYDCAIFVNGREVGRHTGLWDAFRVPIAVEAGATDEILVRVEKPACPRSGPGSALAPGAFPLQETLAGFLPYVWGQIFGGIWQEVELVITGQVVFEDVCVRGEASGAVWIDAALSAPGVVMLEVRDPEGQVVVSTSGRAREAEAREGDTAIDGAAASLRFTFGIPAPQPWSPADPALYEARLRVEDGDERVVRFGLRSLEADGTTLRLNGRPIYPRMALSWGWYPEALHSNPGPERVRADFARLRQLGYNGVKLCLWFPPQYYFDLADELGMLLWVELPMWLPQPSEFFRRQTPLEYGRLARQARNHPSVILYTLGCELNRAAGPEILGSLFAIVKAEAGDALVRDNSGSGEAYGGLLNEFAEFYDYHFYSELHLFRDLIDYFTPRWRPVQPWVFGEFCDLDTFRDLRRFDQLAEDGQSSGRPWWTLDDAERNPQGARWQFDIVAQERRLRATGFWERGAELERLSRQHALLHRKFTLELVRTYREISGYVITGESDTPISTAGMWDDFGELKFDPEAFRAFNDDLVVLVGWDRRRAWIAGGDRSAHWDIFSYRADEVVRPHLIVSHYGAARDVARVNWCVVFPGEDQIAAGERITPFTIEPGEVREVSVAEFAAPGVTAPCQALLEASVRIGDETTENCWPLWFFPRDAWAGIQGLVLIDPLDRLAELPTLAPGLQRTLDGARVAIATAWTPEVEAFVAKGGNAVLLQGQGQAGPLLTVTAPFWREAVRLVEPHPAWRDFPHDGWAGLQFFGCATDLALDISEYRGELNPLLVRLDARTMALHAYAVEIGWGDGRAIVTTLRFEGGQGEQPLGIGRNTAAAYLLSCWVRYLAENQG